LYGQAGEALKRWRERKAAGKDADVEPVEVKLPSVAFVGQLERPQLHLDAVGLLEQELRGVGLLDLALTSIAGREVSRVAACG